MGHKKRPPLHPTPAEAPRYRYPIPLPVRKQATALLEQQLWCFGRDILRSDGNLPLAYGFSRDRLPQGEKGCTAYFLPISQTATVWMWGFGLFWGDSTQGGMYLKRFGFDPRYTAQSAVAPSTWREADVPAAHAPATLEEGAAAHALLLPLIKWLADYEAWVLEQAGVEHRRRVISMLDKRKQVSYDDPAALPNLWRTIATDIDAAYYQVQSEKKVTSNE